MVARPLPSFCFESTRGQRGAVAFLHRGLGGEVHRAGTLCVSNPDTFGNARIGSTRRRRKFGSIFFRPMVGAAQASEAPGRNVPTAAPRATARVKYWQYRGGKAGHGQKWKFMDEDTSRQLEDAYLAGKDSLTLDAEDGWAYFYDLRAMTQTSITGGDEPSTIRAIKRPDSSEVEV